MQAMKDELARSMQTLKSQPTPPYFISYEITETGFAAVSGSFGAVISNNETRRRQLAIDLRVGDYSIDNTHEIRGGGNQFQDAADRFSFIPMPIDDDPAAIRSVLWFETDRKFKRAVERLTRVRTNIQVKVAEEDKSDDFSREAPEKFSEKPAPIKADRRSWEEKVRKYTAPFAKYGNIYDAGASISAQQETRWFVSAEGTEIQTADTRYQLFISAYTKAADGMELPRYESFFSATPEGLPSDDAVQKIVAKMIQDLEALRVAPLVDPYAGPAILSGRASGVFFHEVFGHRIEGHRQKNAEEGQTFKKKINQEVLPAFFSVYFDPTQKKMASTDLMGSYRFDNQGVKARRVTVVEKGVFKQFLMSRSPIESFPKSNGHGRNQGGFAAVSRQSNLIVETSSSLTRDGLKKMLLEQIQKANKPFGLLFDDIQGGFTLTGRTIPNAFNVLPIMVYRVYPDGREELVRGVDLIGTPLTAFSKIVAADDQMAVFNGVCGAESGGVPVSAVSPGILISQIEVQKKEKSQDRPPILPPPFPEDK